MKKFNFGAFLSTAVVCYIFWLFLTGQIVSLFTGEASLQVLLAGAFVSVVTSLVFAKFFIHKRPFHLFNPLKFFWFVYYWLFVFMWELIKANVNVAKMALSPRISVNPGIVKIKTELIEDYSLFALANSITLTPGTITLDIAEENGNTYLYIHWIDVESENTQKAGDIIKGAFEKHIRRIWE